MKRCSTSDVGAVRCLLAAAKRLPRGRAIGVDLWRADQTDNSQQATLANAALENVADRVEVHTADMTALPLADDSVDVIVSSLAIHNIPTRAGSAAGAGRSGSRAAAGRPARHRGPVGDPSTCRPFT